MRLKTGFHYYWRFRGTTNSWRYGWPSDAGGGLIRMGYYNGDTFHGPIVRECDIEYTEY
jgi:hypothetical protein